MVKWRGLCFFLGLWPAAALMAAQDDPVVPGSALVSANPLVVLLGLLFVVGLIFLLAWLLRRLGAVPMQGGQQLKVVAALSVGTREKVVVVDVAGKQVMLGVAPGRVSTLHVFEQPVIALRSAKTDDFSAKIKQILQQREGNDVDGN